MDSVESGYWTGSKNVMVNSGGTFNGDSAFGRRREKKGSKFSASFLPFLLNEVREREGRGGREEWINTSGWTEEREGGEDLPAEILWDLFGGVQVWGNIDRPIVIEWCPLGPPGSAPRIPGERRARIHFEVALPSPILEGCARGRIQLALKTTNTSDWPRLKGYTFRRLTLSLDFSFSLAR